MGFFMINGLRFELKEVGPIADAKLDINKINIIGGQNSTGKSTVSKLLYCFLKVNSSNRDKLIAPVIVERLDKFYLSLRFYNHYLYAPIDDLISSTRQTKKLINTRNYEDFDEILDWIDDLEDLLIKNIEEIETKLKDEPTKIQKDYGEGIENFNEEFNKVKRILQIVEEGSNEFFEEAIKQLLFSELEIEFPSEFNQAKFYDSLNSKFSFDIDFNKTKFESYGKFNISNVFYLESFFIFDNYLSHENDSEHVDDLKDHLFPKKLPSKMFEDETMKKLEENVSKIVGGRIIKKDGNLKFVSKETDYTCSMKNTASGIKQIAVIQTLLHHRFLESGSVLIIDEPEVNLHPEWQIKLARIFVLLAKEGNITIYINSHSPMFIEAIDTFAEYYDFEEYVNYYLSEQSEEDKNRFDFKEVPSDELYLIYDNLGDPYDYLDRVRLSKGRKEVDNDLNF